MKAFTEFLPIFIVGNIGDKLAILPFVICGVAIFACIVASSFGNEKAVSFFKKLFIFSFLTFWFGFLIFAAYLCIRDKNYNMLLFSIPFWLAGIYLVKNKFIKSNSKKKAKSSNMMTKFNFPIIGSGLLVVGALIAGIFIFALGIKDKNTGLILVGGFFVVVASVFVLFALKIKGVFDGIKTDIIKLYAGIAITVIGLGIIVFIYFQTNSFSLMLDTMGFWIIVPIIMAVFGVIAIIQSIKNKD